MSEMVERVARALFAVAAPYTDKCCSKPKFEECQICARDAREHARAAIEAMREPTEAMVTRAMADDGTSMPLARGYDEVWQSMIDEALK